MQFLAPHCGATTVISLAGPQLKINHPLKFQGQFQVGTFNIQFKWGHTFLFFFQTINKSNTYNLCLQLLEIDTFKPLSPLDKHCFLHKTGSFLTIAEIFLCTIFVLLIRMFPRPAFPQHRGLLV